MDDSLISFAMWRRAPGSVRLATLLLVARAACLVPLPVMLYLLKQQMSGVVPQVLGQVAPVGAISVVTAALDLTVAGLLLLASSRAALRSPQPPGF